MPDERAPEPLREGVRSAILSALERDFELAGARTARRLAGAGAIGVAGAVGLTLLLAGHPFDHHPPWHVAVFSALWAGLLVVALSLVFLGVRTPVLRIGEAASIAVLGLGLAGICGMLCPDPHFLRWWGATHAGAWLGEVAGTPASVLCFGAATAFAVGLAATVLVVRGRRPGPGTRLLPAAALFVLLLPGIALQSVGTSLAAFGAWSFGAAFGSWAGVASALALRPRAAMG
jgi:hypothetical protein